MGRSVVTSGPPLLQFCRVLVVEDSAIIAAKLSRVLRQAGAEVMGPVATVNSALGAIEAAGSIDAALLDVDLRGEPVYRVAETLFARGVPFLFLTGYDPEILSEPWCHWPVMQKPFASETILSAVQALMIEAQPSHSTGAIRTVTPESRRLANAINTTRNLIMERHILSDFTKESLPKS
ncbi:MAG: hypothetical protein JO139_13355 [Alphaproteobacteria bacterium]|nr:hypothetical protein [Alphaproteobacteria bacterium]